MELRVVAQDHAGIEDAIGVEQGLDPLHDLVGAIAPFVADERGHVAPGPVLGLEGAVVLPHHHRDQLAHERVVAAHGRGVGEVLREHEVQVAVAGVAEGDGVVEVVLGVEDLQVGDGFGQPLHRHHDVLDHDRGAGRPDARPPTGTAPCAGASGDRAPRDRW